MSLYNIGPTAIRADPYFWRKYNKRRPVHIEPESVPWNEKPGNENPCCNLAQAVMLRALCDLFERPESSEYKDAVNWFCDWKDEEKHVFSFPQICGIFNFPPQETWEALACLLGEGRPRMISRVSGWSDKKAPTRWWEEGIEETSDAAVMEK